MRSRRQNLLVDAQSMFAFYESRVPPAVCTVHDFERWRTEAEKKSPRLLRMTESDVLAAGATLGIEQLYPDNLQLGDTGLRLEYRLDPGGKRDGVTVRMPLEAVARADPERFGWLVPGLLREKIETMIKGLPREKRRLLDSSEKLADAAARHVTFGKGSLAEQVAEFLRSLTGHDITREDLARVEMPEFLRMHFEVVDESGKPIAEGRDLHRIRHELAPRIKGGEVRPAKSPWIIDGLTDWTFPDPPDSITIERMGSVLKAYPALFDAGATVSLRLFDSTDAAASSMRPGARRLFMLAAGEEFRRAVRYLPGVDRGTMTLAPIGDPARLRDDLVSLIADRAFLGDSPPPRRKADFDRMLDTGLTRIGRAIDDVTTLFAALAAGVQACALLVESQTPSAWAYVHRDVGGQLAALTPAGFLLSTPWEWLTQYPRFLSAIQVRYRKLPGPGLDRDRRLAAEFAPYIDAYNRAIDKRAEVMLDETALRQYRWMLEEYRVSLFAQELRTSIPVSPKRLQELWQKVIAKAVAHA